MRLFFQSVAEAIIEKGLRGIVGLVPGGPALYDIAESAWKKYRERCKQVEQLKEIQRIAQAGTEEVERIAREVAQEVACSQSEMVQVELYLEQIPGSVRQSLKRRDDPTGKSVPGTFSLRCADDMVKLLPPGLPQFRPGDALPGKAGWVLERQLGIGGFGEVWLARHPQFKTLSGAVKFCRDLQNRDRDMLHESKVIDRLLAHGSHAHIVRLTDVHLEGDAPWLMYEYVEGGDLADLIHQWAGLLPTERQHKALSALHELAATISHFHRLDPPIVHRDLKPANILRDGQGRLRITDFGIGGVAARQIMENESRGKSSHAGRLQSYLYGSYTPLYASPQQRMGANPDPRDDVHALGVIGYQMLTAQLVQSAGADMQEELEEAGVDRPLIDLLRRCTAQKAERRPKDASEVAELLRKLHSSNVAVDSLVPVATKQSTADAYDPYADIRRDQEEFDQDLIELDEEDFDGIDHLMAERIPTRLARWKEAAENGFSCGQFLYGVCFECGTGVPQDAAESIAWYRKAAEQRHTVSQYHLGWLYENGRGVSQDFEKAVLWYRKAADQGHNVAQYHLGCIYEDGEYEAADYQEAVKWYRKAAEQGNSRAQNNLAAMYRRGIGVPQDDAQAANWYRKAAEQGLYDAQNSLGFMFENGIGLSQDYTQAVAWYRKAAEHRNSRGEYNLGRMYEEGRGVAQDEVQAVAWYRKAAEQGYAIAQYDLGVMYEEGRGVAQDEVEAAAWYRKAADKAHGAAQLELGRMYQEGRGLEQDDAEAFLWYRKAADRGISEAQCYLGLMFQQGRGVLRDYEHAVFWYRKAAEQGNSSAQFNLGVAFAYGRGEPQDDEEAVAWFRKAAEQGQSDAQFALGVMYQNGRGISQDNEQAVIWYRKAACQGNENAAAAMRRLGAAV